MLHSRVSQITTYLTAVSQGKAKKDDETLRQIQALVSGLKGQVGGGQLEKEFMTVRLLQFSLNRGQHQAETD